jgi:hypothetical protein
VLYPSQEVRDAVINSRMEHGVAESYNKLADVLASTLARGPHGFFCSCSLRTKRHNSTHIIRERTRLCSTPSSTMSDGNVRISSLRWTPAMMFILTGLARSDHVINRSRLGASGSAGLSACAMARAELSRGLGIGCWGY